MKSNTSSSRLRTPPSPPSSYDYSSLPGTPESTSIKEIRGPSSPPLSFRNLDRLPESPATPTLNFPLEPLAQTSTADPDILPEAPSFLASTESTTGRRDGETGDPRDSNPSQSNGPRKILLLSDLSSLTLICNAARWEKKKETVIRKQTAKDSTTGSSSKRVSKTSSHTKWSDNLCFWNAKSCLRSLCSIIRTEGSRVIYKPLKVDPKYLALCNLPNKSSFCAKLSWPY